MGGHTSKKKAAAASSCATTTASSTNHPRRRIAQNYLLIWVDATINETNKDSQKTLTELRAVVNDVTICKEPNQCRQFLDAVDYEKAFVITSGSLGQHLVPEIHNIQQLDSIYIFCNNKTHHEEWAKKWNKIKGVHTQIKSICDALQLAIKQCNQDTMPVSFVGANEGASVDNPNQLDPTFMYTQIFKEILLDMDDDQQAIKTLSAYCRKSYDGNLKELEIIDKFERDYRPDNAIWWYTCECFTYQMLNRSLRLLEADTIINMGFFIRHLHKQIEQLYKSQVSGYKGKPFTVYRGQGLSVTDFETLRKSKGGLMSFNNFLSTSKKQEVSLHFAEEASIKKDTVGIVFIMSIHPAVTSSPFANIRAVSAFQREDEILFSMHTVFRIRTIKPFENNDRLYEVELQRTADDDEQLRVLTKRIREEAKGNTGWKQLGKLLLRIGQLTKAEELYLVLLEQTSNEGERAYYYHHLGYVKDQQGDYAKAVECYEKALKIKEKTLSENHPDLATSNNNIGLVYHNMGQYAKALSCYEKALEIYQKTLPINPSSLATSYNNIGEVYRNMGQHAKALSFYDKTREIFEKTLPANHPSLATTYNNIGLVYMNMGQHAKALSFYEKTRQIFEKTLPTNHPDLATSYNNIGWVYRNMGDYSKALLYYERAKEIWQLALPPTHPNLQKVKESIESVKKKL